MAKYYIFFIDNGKIFANKKPLWLKLFCLVPPCLNQMEDVDHYENEVSNFKNFQLKADLQVIQHLLKL